jgi:hypothetical protein
VAYKDSGNSGYGTACVLNISGATITPKTPVVFISTNVDYVNACTLLLNASQYKALIAYKSTGTNMYGYACIATISVDGTSLLFTTPEIIYASEAGYIECVSLSGFKALGLFWGDYTYGVAGLLTIDENDEITNSTDVNINKNGMVNDMDICKLSDDKILVAYNDEFEGLAYAVIGTIEGNSITFGPPKEFTTSVEASYISICALTDSKALIAFKDVTSLCGYSVVISIVDNQIEPPGIPVSLSNNTEYISICKLTEDKVLAVYQDLGNSGYGTARVLSINGVTITGGTPVVFESANTTFISVCAFKEDKAIVAYRDVGNSNYGTACILDISGTIITAGTSKVFLSALTGGISICKLSEDRALVVYSDGSRSNFGSVCVLTLAYSGVTFGVGLSSVFGPFTAVKNKVCAIDSHKAIVVCQDFSSTYGIISILHTTNELARWTCVYTSNPIIFKSKNISGDISAVGLTNDLLALVYGYNATPYPVAQLIDGFGDVVETASNIIGIALESKEQGESCEVSLGVITSDLSGLIPGKTYYLADDSSLTLKETNYKIGVAVSPTELRQVIQKL